LGGEHVAIVVDRELDRRLEGLPPAGGGHQVGWAEGADEQAEGRRDPDQTDQDDGHVHWQALKPAHQPFSVQAGGGGRAGGGGHAGRRHRIASCSRKRWMLMIMIGMMAASNTTAMALARP